MMGCMLGHYRAGIADITTAIATGIAVENLAIKSGGRNTDAVSITHYRREIADADYPAAALRRDAHKRDNIVVHIVGVDEVEPGRLAIGFPQRRFLSIDAIQIAHQRLQSAMVLVFKQVPVEALV